MAAASAAIPTALLLQASVVAPVTVPYPISIVAVLVAAVGLVDGPATGMAFGFTAGLVADLGSQHPAGALALCWLAVGLLSGAGADRRSVPVDVLTAAVLCGLASSAATLLLALVGSGAAAADAARQLLPVIAGDLVLAVLLLPLVRRLLHTEWLRAPHPVYTELALDARRG